MGSSSKQHLKQLLNQDQEPFVLESYIHEQRSLLNKLPRARASQVKRQNSIRENFCKNVCFFSLQNSPIGTKSPLFDFSSSQSKTPRNSNNSNTVFVHIPARTAALLLEAAIRIQNQSEKQKAASKNGFGFFGSIFNRLRRRKKNDFERDNEIKVCVRDILRWESQDVCRNAYEEKTEQVTENEENTETSAALGYEDKRISDVGLSSSSGWTESIEAKSSIDLETSTSRSDDEDAESCCVQQPECNNGDFYLCEKGSPFRFLLDTVLSPRRRSPEFMSPATSPNRRKNQVENNVEGNLKKSDGQEEEKEYCSPVSVLELQVDDNVEEQDEEEEDEDDSELERSFAFVHKARRKLLQKLRRFERLAGLDPLDLEKRLTEDEDSDDGAVEDGDEEEDYEEEESVLNSNGKRSPEDMKKLLLHLMNEEGAVGGASVGNKRCKRLGSLKNAERNMVNMMVEMDFRGEQKEWQKNSEQVEETVVAIEFGIFEFLVEELSVELVES
ncbi:hypothetical protein ACHQM5_021273 [Ranunculus cassubicifolius]